MPIVATHNIVYAHVKGVAVVAYSRTVSAGYVAVGEFFCHAMSGVRDGAVVEIATKNHAVSLVLSHESGHGIYLRGAHLGIFAQLMYQTFAQAWHLFGAQVAFKHVLKILPLGFG